MLICCLLLLNSRLERLFLVLGVGPGPAVRVPGQPRVQQDVDLEIRTESTNTGLSALRQSWNLVPEPPEDDPDLSVPVITRPTVVLSELLVTLSLHGPRTTKQQEVLRSRRQGNTETNQQGVARVQSFQGYLEPSVEKSEGRI